MVSWSTMQQVKYGGIIAVFLAIVLVGVYFLSFNNPESCFDGKKNQDETSVDCDGVCSSFCASGAEVIVEWSRILERTTGAIDVVAFVHNPNTDLATQEVSYTFSIYDDNNLLITEREGNTYVNAQEEFVLLERGIEVGERSPERVFLEIQQVASWKEVGYAPPQLSVTNRTLLRESETTSGLAQLTATLVNNSFDVIENSTLSALIFDTQGTVVGASSTSVPELPPESSRPISFSFPHSLPLEVGRIEIRIRTKNQI